MTERQNLEQKLRGLSENDGFTDFQKRDIDRLICETVNP
jgi:hypothetical protein